VADLIELMETCKAIRWFKPDPVPIDLMERILRAANCAPSPGNSQGWHFVVVRHRATKERLGQAFLPALEARWSDEQLVTGAPNFRMYRGVLELARHLGDVPALVIVAGIPTYPEAEHDPARLLVNSMYGVIQNLVVAARSVGLGTTLTLFHEIDEEAVRSLAGIPPDARIAAVVPLGWPAEPFTRVSRRPVDEIIHWESW
jgi:nitroreductase